MVNITLVTKDLDRNIQFESDNGKIMIKTDKEPTNTTFKVLLTMGESISLINMRGILSLEKEKI